MASFKVKFPALQELFAKNHRGAFAPPPPSGARVSKIGANRQLLHLKVDCSDFGPARDRGSLPYLPTTPLPDADPGDGRWGARPPLGRSFSI